MFWRSEHVERRRVLVDRRDQDAAHPLLQEQLEVVALPCASLSLLQMNTATPWARATSSMPLATSVKNGLAASSMT